MNYSLRSLPSNPGTYNISVKVNDEDVPLSPYKLQIKPLIDFSRIGYKLLKNNYKNKLFLNEPCEIAIYLGSILPEPFRIEVDQGMIDVAKVEGSKCNFHLTPTSLGSASVKFFYDDEMIGHLSPLELNIVEAPDINNFTLSTIPESFIIGSLIDLKRFSFQ